MGSEKRSDSTETGVRKRGRSLDPVPLGSEQGKSLEPHRPVYTGDAGNNRRRKLAAILWGEPDEPGDILEPVRKKRAREASERRPIRSASGLHPPAVNDALVRSSQRRQCSFPGVIRVLIPEVSFQPRTFAVRIVDISRFGARMETRQVSADLAEILARQQWHARLEAIVPTHGRVMIAGTIAWLEYDQRVSLVGVQFNAPCEQVDDFFMSNVNEDTAPAQLTLPPPILDAFPTVTRTSPFKFRGRARGAEKIIVRTRRREYAGPVIDGRFELEVPLELDTSNFVTVASATHDEASFPTPVCIVHKAGVRDTISYQASSVSDELSVDADARRVSLSVSGPPQRFFLVLDRIAKALQFAEDVSLTVEIQGDPERTARKLSEAVDRPITGISEE